MSKEKVVPEIRFEGFSDDWDKKELSKVTERVVRKNFDLVSMNPLTISAQAGLISQLDYYNFQVASKNLSNYYLLSKGDFAYNKSYSNGYPVGAIKRLDYYEKGLLSTLYIVFRPTNVNSEFLKHYYESNYWHKGIYDIAEEGARNHGLLNVAPIQFFETHVNLPVSDLEQSRIGNLFEKIEGNIKKRDHEIYKLKNFKQSMLQKMFPKEGETVPEVRFEGFEGEWKTKSLKEFLRSEFKGKAQAEKLSLGHTEYLDANRLNGGQPIRVNATKDVWRDDILILWDGSKAGTVYFGFEGVLGSTLKSFVVNQENYPAFIYQYLRGENHNITTNYRTPNIPHVVRNFTETFKIPTPTYEEQKKIGKYFNVIDENLHSKQAELNKLKQFKQAMLDKMFV